MSKQCGEHLGPSQLGSFPSAYIAAFGGAMARDPDLELRIISRVCQKSNPCLRCETGDSQDLNRSGRNLLGFWAFSSFSPSWWVQRANNFGDDSGRLSRLQVSGDTQKAELLFLSLG